MGVCEIIRLGGQVHGFGIQSVEPRVDSWPAACASEDEALVVRNAGSCSLQKGSVDGVHHGELQAWQEGIEHQGMYVINFSLHGADLDDDDGDHDDVDDE